MIPYNRYCLEADLPSIYKNIIYIYVLYGQTIWYTILFVPNTCNVPVQSWKCIYNTLNSGIQTNSHSFPNVHFCIYLSHPNYLPRPWVPRSL